MSDIHILTGNGQKWTIVFHFAVPDQNNNIGVNYRTALVNSRLGGTSMMAEGTEAGQIATAELALIAADEIYEHSEQFLAESGATNNTEMLAAAQALYVSRETTVLTALQKRLRYFGYAGSAT